MKKTSTLLFFLVSFLLAQGQGSHAEFLMTVDNTTGSYSRINKIPDVKWIRGGVSSASIDQDSNRYIFYGKDRFNNHRIYTIDIASGIAQYAPYIYPPTASDEGFDGFQYIGNNTVAGLHLKGNAPISFVHVDITNGIDKVVSDFKFIYRAAWGKPLYDSKNGHYIFIGLGTTGGARIVTVEAKTGKVIRSPFISGISSGGIGGLVLNPKNNTVYCLYNEANQSTIGSINTSTGAVSKFKTLKYTGIISSPSFVTFDEANNLLVCRLTNGGTATYLVSIDLATGNEVYKPRFDAPANETGGNIETRANIIELGYHRNSGKIIALGWREVGNWTPPPPPPVDPPAPPVDLPPVDPPAPVYVDSNTYHIWVPDAFTPHNRDNLNNVFAPVFSHESNYSMTIYDGWGEVLLQCEDCAWDGYYRNEKIPKGTYMYKLLIRRKGFSYERLMRGYVHVLW